MTTQDVAILATAQLAILTAAALTAWTCWSAGYERGWEDRAQRDPFHRFVQAVKRMGSEMSKTLAAVNASIDNASTVMVEDLERWLNREGRR